MTQPWIDPTGHSVEEFVAALAAKGPRQLLGVAGPPGSGKTTAAHHLAHAFAHSAVVPVDGFHLSNAQLRRTESLDRKGAPDTFDVPGLVTALQRLRTARGDVYLPGFEHVIDDPIAAEHVVAADCTLVIVEGNYLLVDEGPWAAVRPLLDAVIYLDVPWSLARPRLVARQMAKGKDRERAEAWVDRSDQANFDLITTTRDRADLVVAAEPARS